MENYKQKYEEAIFRMNKWVEGSEIIDPKEVAEFVFPELKESEDEKIRKKLIHFLEDVLDLGKNANFNKYCKSDCAGWIAWLKKQKDHEDELEKAYKTADEVQYRRGYEAAKREFEKQGEMKPAWSEEDEHILEAIIKEIEANKAAGPEYDEKVYDMFLSWLKSIKERYTWKPSNEQIRAIEDAIKFLGCTKKVREDLKSLYEQLKKLREE